MLHPCGYTATYSNGDGEKFLLLRGESSDAGMVANVSLWGAKCQYIALLYPCAFCEFFRNFCFSLVGMFHEWGAGDGRAVEPGRAQGAR